MSSSEIKDFGSILKVTNYGERDKLIHIFLQNHGVIKAFAFGAKNSKKRFGGNLEPYNLQFFNIAQKNQLYSITEVKINKLFLEIRKSITALEMLQNVSKLLTKLPVLESKKTFKVFYFLLTKLNHIENIQDMFKAYYFFIIFLLTKEGVFPQYTACFNCSNKQTDFLLSSKNEPQFLCNNCITDININSTLTDEYTTTFIKLCMKSPKKLFSETFPPKTYFFLNKIITTLIAENFHLSLTKINYQPKEVERHLG